MFIIAKPAQLMATNQSYRFNKDIKTNGTDNITMTQGV